MDKGEQVMGALAALCSVFVSLGPGECMKCGKHTHWVLVFALDENPEAESSRLGEMGEGNPSGFFICDDHLVGSIESFGNAFLQAVGGEAWPPVGEHLH